MAATRRARHEKDAGGETETKDYDTKKIDHAQASYSCHTTRRSTESFCNADGKSNTNAIPNSIGHSCPARHATDRPWNASDAVCSSHAIACAGNSSYET